MITSEAQGCPKNRENRENRENTGKNREKSKRDQENTNTKHYLLCFPVLLLVCLRFVTVFPWSLS